MLHDVYCTLHVVEAVRMAFRGHTRQRKASKESTMTECYQYYNGAGTRSPRSLDSLHSASTSVQGSGNNALERLVRSCFTGRDFFEDYEVAAKVLLAPSSGYLLHRDIFCSRVINIVRAESIVSFATPDDSFLTAAALDCSSLLAALSSSPGALIATRSALSTMNTLDELERRLRQSSSFNWTVAMERPLCRVAVVAACPMFGVEKGFFGSRGPLEAIETLGLSMIVLDSPGHWLGRDAYSHLRHVFISVDLTINPELPYRIASSLRGRDIDGIVTFTSELAMATAQAADILILPSESPKALLRAHQHRDRVVQSSNHKSQTLQLHHTQTGPGFPPDAPQTCSENHDHWRSGSKHSLAACDSSGKSYASGASDNFLPDNLDPGVPATEYQDVELVCLLWQTNLLSCGVSEVLSKRWSVTADQSRNDFDRAAECSGFTSNVIVLEGDQNRKRIKISLPLTRFRPTTNYDNKIAPALGYILLYILLFLLLNFGSYSFRSSPLFRLPLRCLCFRFFDYLEDFFRIKDKPTLYRYALPLFTFLTYP